MSFEALLKKVRESKDADLPFVIYRKPDDKVVNAIIQNDKRLEYSDDFLGTGFIMAPFNENERAVLFAEENSNKFRCVISEDEYTPINESKNQVQERSESASKAQHLKLVKKGIERIQNGDFIKTVLSRSEIVAIETLDVTVVFKRLMSTYQSAFVYVWFHPEIGLWAGASPETLLKTKGDSFHTMALAGTQKYEDTVEVSWGDKESTEQQIVTDHIVDSLDSLKPMVSETYTKKAGNLLHLCTDITGRLQGNSSLKDLIGKLHPTAAVCGLPRNEVRNFILKEEGYSRSFYTGFLGELNIADAHAAAPKTTHENLIESSFFVNLRCMQLYEGHDSKAVIYVGGGITIDSDPLSEWEETVDKSLIMKRVINA